MSDARSYTDRCGKTMRKKAQAVVIKIRIGEGSTQSSSCNSLGRADESESTCRRSAQCHHGQRLLLLARTSWTTTRTLQRSITFIYYTLDSFIRLYTQASIYIATKLLPRDLSLDDPDVPGTRDTLAQARAATLPPSHLVACTG